MPISTNRATGQTISAADINAIATLVNSLETTLSSPVTLARVAAGTRLAAPLNGTLNTSAAMARPSARTDIFFNWYSTVQPNNMIAGDTWEAPTA